MIAAAWPHAVDGLIVGAGMSGLGTAAFWAAAAPTAKLVIAEKADEPGGYCRTIRREGFTWDYSGHFFHFRDPDMKAWLCRGMPAADVVEVVKRSFIRYGQVDVDFPFQKNIHQLPRQDFIECLHDAYFADRGRDTGAAGAASFKARLIADLGRGIVDKFLAPYNEKLYACDLDSLDADAMGRFFPKANFADIVTNMRHPDNGSYNATFTYPRAGAAAYVDVLRQRIGTAALNLETELVALAPAQHRATLRQGGATFSLTYKHLVSSMPLPALWRMATAEDVGLQQAVPTAALTAFSSNKVLVFNLGFDGKGRNDAHWIYFPDRSRSYYRVGFYDNIFGDPRMSLYVEIGLSATATIGAAEIEAYRHRVMQDLVDDGIVANQALVAWHAVVLDPAYVHITKQTLAAVPLMRAALATHGIHSIGRYGAWTYCSIEDNLLEARALVDRLTQGTSVAEAAL